MGSTLSSYISTEFNLDFSYIYTGINNVITYLNTSSIEYNKEHITTAISNLRNTLNFLDEKITSMNDNTKKYITEGKKLYKQNNKTGALHQIKLKKM